MSAPPAVARPFAPVWDATAARLDPLGRYDAPLDPALAARDGRMRLTAARWRVGPAAECRIVRILGAAAEVVNVLIFPADPGRVPVFAAELLAVGGRPRLAFLDLQTPGQADDVRGAVAGRARAVAARFAGLPRDPDPPGWAVRHSPGGFLFTRTDDPGHAPDLCAACLAYLGAWADLAAGPPAPVAGGSDALAAYKREHLTHAPSRPFLAKVYGDAWADRFLAEFLYG